ncbi:MAG TPA: electron transfer flavoprotein subunit alpha/FixB family protein, partial [Thermoplasmata archaeon]|nr:electron transfer flavoprotein subunit alpha/FixB family protein [Thermoplasmata archaeon]
ENEEPTRHARVFAEGRLDDRIEGAAVAVEELLHAPPLRPAPLPPVSSSAPEREVLVLVSGPTGRTDLATLGVLSELRRWGSHLWPSAVWVGRPPPAAERTRVARAGAAHGYLIRDDRPYLGSRTVARALGQLLHVRPSLAGAVVLADPFGRDVGGQLAARGGLGLTGDAVGLSANAPGELAWRKPAFGGGLVATISSRTRPSLATVRPGAFAPSTDPTAHGLELEELPGVPGVVEPEWLESGYEQATGWGDLESARAVVVIGMGLGGPEHLPDLQPTLSSWRASLGGTRRVVDAGWLPGGRQVGLTGLSLAADLAVLVGVSGAGNHLIGLRRTRVLLAINPDPAAPVFPRVDVGIVGGWAEVLPSLTARLAPLARSRTVASE